MNFIVLFWYLRIVYNKFYLTSGRKEFQTVSSGYLYRHTTRRSVPQLCSLIYLGTYVGINCYSSTSIHSKHHIADKFSNAVASSNILQVSGNVGKRNHFSQTSIRDDPYDIYSSDYDRLSRTCSSLDH